MSPARTLAAAAVVATLWVAGGCGGSASTPDQGAAPTVSSTPTTAAATPTPTRTPTSSPTPTRTPKPSRAASPTADGGDGDADETVAPSTAGGGVCSHLGAEEVGAILGTTVRGAAVPGETGCTFSQGGQRGTTVTVLDRSTAKAGGMAGAKDEATSAVEGDPQDVAGIGSAAFVVTGSMFGGPEVQAAGAVQVGGRIVSVFVEQHSGLSAKKVRSLELELLRLVAARAG
jgi:hypothetical protein